MHWHDLATNQEKGKPPPDNEGKQHVAMDVDKTNNKAAVFSVICRSVQNIIGVQLFGLIWGWI